MTFLAVDAQKNLFTMKKSQLQFEQTIIMNRASMITKEMGDYSAAQGDNWDAEQDGYYISLQQTEEYLESTQDNLDSQIALMDAQINSLKQLVNNNIKNGAGLNLIGS